MVKPEVIRITAELVGLKKIDLPQFSGYDIMVSLRGMGELEPDVEFTNLPTGGFELAVTDDEDEQQLFILGEVYTVTPLPKSIAAPFSNPVYPATQYPHSMVLTTVAASTQDSSGNWQPGGTTTIEKACRAEPNNKNAFIIAADGSQLYYAYIVYMPLPVNHIPVGTKVVVYDGDDVLTDAIVKRFSKGQLNARLWL